VTVAISMINSIINRVLLHAFLLTQNKHLSINTESRHIGGKLIFPGSHTRTPVCWFCYWAEDHQQVRIVSVFENESRFYICC
jgi:hypothetical protein